MANALLGTTAGPGCLRLGCNNVQFSIMQVAESCQNPLSTAVSTKWCDYFATKCYKAQEEMLKRGSVWCFTGLFTDSHFLSHFNFKMQVWIFKQYYQIRQLSVLVFTPLGCFCFISPTLSHMSRFSSFSNSNFHSAIKLWVVKHWGNSICMHSVYHLRNGRLQFFQCVSRALVKQQSYRQCFLRTAVLSRFTTSLTALCILSFNW